MEKQAQRLRDLINSILAGKGTSHLAKQVDVSAVTVQNWLKGKYFPDKTALKKLAQLKGWTLDELDHYLSGETLPATADISMSALREAIKKLSLPELLEVGQYTFSVAESHINNNILSVKRSATIKVFQGTNMTIEGLLKTLSASISLAELEQLLDAVRLPLARFNELANGAIPTDDELRQLGLLLDDAGIRNANNIRFSHDDLKVMRGAPKDCRHHHTNGIN